MAGVGSKAKLYPSAQMPIIVNNWSFCDFCFIEGQLEWKCIQCMQILCSRCKTAHGNGRATMNHFCFNKSDQSKEEYWIKVFKCSIHTEKNVTLYCKDDEICICQICLLKNHKGHDVVEYEDYADSIRRDIEISITELNTDVGNTVSAITDKAKRFLQQTEKRIKFDKTQNTKEISLSLNRMKCLRDAELIYRQKEISSIMNDVRRLTLTKEALHAFNSNHLTEVNPNIADLSDTHRPTEVGEMFGQLYDDEWSDAFEALKPPREDEEEEEDDICLDVLMMLQKIVMKAFDYCSKEVESQMNKLQEDIAEAFEIKPSNKDGDKGDKQAEEGGKGQMNLRLKYYVEKQAKEMIKGLASFSSQNAADVFVSEQLPTIVEGEKCKENRVII